MIVPVVPQNVGRVAQVVEAFVAVRLVTFPVVPQKVGKVAYVVEAEQREELPVTLRDGKYAVELADKVP